MTGPETRSPPKEARLPSGADDAALRESSVEPERVSAWPVVATVAAAVVSMLAVYWQTAASIVAIWWRSETFAHGFLVIPVCIWLVWRRRQVLATIPVRPWWPGLLLVAASGGMWLVMSAADVLGLKQFALVFMIQAGIVSIVGLQMARALAFPLAFLLFAVPVGELFVPKLIDWTADFTVVALRASGVPVFREANHFVIPSGSWAVTEACSGIRYIIASIMVGTIFAAIAYRRPLRRAYFLAAAALLPIVANWMRAYLIVMIGHFSSNRIAVGVDHIIYGWLFFGVVMLLLFWVGSFWQETGVGRPVVVALPSARPASRAAFRSMSLACLAVVALAAVWLPVEGATRRAAPSAAVALSAPLGQDGWQTVVPESASWRPRYSGYVASALQTYRRQGKDVTVYLAYYRNQSKGSELVTSSNVLVPMEDRIWKLVGEGKIGLPWHEGRAEADHAQVAGTSARLDVARLYWVAGAVTGSEYVAKALLAWAKLAGRGDDSALVVIYTREPDGADESESTLTAFSASMSGAIERALVAAGGGK